MNNFVLSKIFELSQPVNVIKKVLPKTQKHSRFYLTKARASRHLIVDD